MRVLVTGAGGFVGRAVVPALAASGHRVRAAARYGTPLQIPAGSEAAFHGDLADTVDWTPLVAGCDAVVHLAGIAHVGPSVPAAMYDRINHQITASLARAAQDAGVSRFVFMSSIRAQTGPAANHILKESDEPRPTEAYGASKLAAELALASMSLPCVVLRPTLVYGPGVKGNFATLLRLARLPVPLPFGDLRKQRSLAGIDGLVAAVTMALENAAMTGQTFIVADPSPVSVAQIISALRRGFGRAPGLIEVPRNALRAMLTVLGKADVLERIDGELVATPAKLIATGWHPPMDTVDALAALAKKMS